MPLRRGAAFFPAPAREGIRLFRKIERSVSLFLEWVGMALLVLMVLVVCYTVFTRYFLSFTPSWGEESALLCMVWFGFLSIALGVRDDLHLSITILDKVIPSGLMKLFSYFKYLCSFGFALFMISQGWKITEIGRRNLFPGLQVSSAWLYAAVPVAGFAIMVYSLEKLYLLYAHKCDPKILETGDENGDRGCEA